MIPKIIHQVWFGDRPEEIRQLMLTVRAMHPGWEFKMWHEDNIEKLGLNWADLIDKCQNAASVSNIVRLFAVLQHGGFYLDCDVRSQNPLTPLLIHRAVAAFQSPTDERICNAIFGAEPKHPWIAWQLLPENLEALKNADAARGVYMMTDAPRQGLTLIWSHKFYPIGWENTPAERKLPTDSYTDHYWNGSWKQK